MTRRSKSILSPWLWAAAASLTTVLVSAMPATAQSPGNGAPAMKVRDLYPLVTTPALFEARDFYVTHFGFQVFFEASWFVYLSSPGAEGAPGATLAFMHPDHPSNPPGPETFSGQGMILTLEVEDVDAAFAQLQATGAPIVYPLTDEDWGQRRFMTRDPAGVLVDVLQQTEAEPGYWEQYPVP